MGKASSVIIGVLVLIAVIALAGVAYSELSERYQPSLPEETGSQSGQAEEKNAAPDFTVVDAQGASVKLSECYGKPLVLNFWATWCGPCRSEMDHFEEAAKTYEGKVNFMMINLTDWGGEDVDDVKQFLQEAGYTFPVYYDTAGSAASAYSVSAIPVTVFIDAQGNVLRTQVGAFSSAALNSAVRSLFGV